VLSLVSQNNPQYALGFEDDSSEYSAVPLTGQGAIPSWLNGCLIRNGPAIFHAGDRELAHWFDGFAKLHKFDFGAGGINYSCRFIQSQAYWAACVDHKMERYEFASSPNFGLFEKLRAAIAPPLTDNTNVNILPMGSNWLALTETNHVISFLPDSLATLGPFKFDDHIGAQITTAHPVIDPNTGSIFNVHIELGITNCYLISCLDGGSTSRRVLTRIPVKEPAYMHSFAQTERYIILIESPLRLKAANLIFGVKPYADCYEWKPQMGTSFLVISKEDGSHFRCESAARFFFHQSNAYESGGVIVLDMLSYPDAGVVQSLKLDNVRSGGAIPVSRLERFEINVANKQIKNNYLGSCTLELPRTNFKRTNCLNYRYVYGAGATSELSFLDHVVKLDVESGSHTDWSRADCFYGEPLFVAQPDGVEEDDGVLLCVELDGAEKCSRLLIIDAASLELLAYADIPNMVPFGFHGVYIVGRS
jgi:beta,beta-carotene 9',10'-dioxygenase